MPIRPITPALSSVGRPSTSPPPQLAPKDRFEKDGAASNKHASTATTDGPPTAAAKPKRGHALKDENGKWLPTGNYEVGFGRPPVAYQFSGKPGPGRPRREVSHDHILRRHLEQKRKVRIDGQEKTMSVLELVIATTIKGALQGKDKPLRELRLEIARLFPETVRNENGDAARTSASAAQILDHFFSDLDAAPRPKPVRASNTVDDAMEDGDDD